MHSRDFTSRRDVADRAVGKEPDRVVQKGARRSSTGGEGDEIGERPVGSGR